MLRFNITVHGSKLVANKYRTFAARASRITTNVTYDWAQLHVVRHMVVKPYPAKRPGQKYVRTFRLQSGWQADPTKNGAVIYNRMPYAGYVVGDAKGKGQVWFHKGRWWIMRKEIDAARPELTRMMMREIDRAIARGGAGWPK